MIDLIVRGGTVVTPSSTALADVAVEGGQIVALTTPGTLEANGAHEIDAEVAELIDSAVSEAQNAEPCDPAHVTEDVYVAY